MRKLVAITFVTLDGVMQAPGGPGEDDSGDFKYGGWSVHYWDDMMAEVMGANFAKLPELVLGRKTYDVFAGYWPNAQDEPGADNLNNAKKYVASRTLDKVDWNNSTLMKGDVVEEIIRLKGLDGPELQVHGSSDFLQTLLKNNLVDEMQLWVFPVTVGNGKRFFGEGTNAANFKLLDTKITTTGVIIATYELSGDLKTGTFALDAAED